MLCGGEKHGHDRSGPAGAGKATLVPVGPHRVRLHRDGLAWLWWRAGELAFRLTREMREALWRRHQVLNGWVERSVVLAENEGGKRWEH